MNHPRILFVEDDPYLGTIIRDLLEKEGFSVELFKTGESGLERFTANKPDLCLLDVMLPGISGFEVGRKIRILDKRIPVLYLTAKSQKEDVIEGFETGADDYLKKPFVMEELVLRIRALLRRTIQYSVSQNDKAEFRFGRYLFIPDSRTLTYAGNSVELTHRESEILRLLCSNQNLIVERNLILKKVWGDDSYFNARSMDVFLARLRKHFKDDPQCRIVNVRGIGFKLLVSP